MFKIQLTSTQIKHIDYDPKPTQNKIALMAIEPEAAERLKERVKVTTTVLRDGKYVGGRINELVFRTPDVTDYILNHPAEEIGAGNLVI